MPFLLSVRDSGPCILSLNDPGLVSNSILPFWVQLLIAEWDHNLTQSFPGIFLGEQVRETPSCLLGLTDENQVHNFSGLVPCYAEQVPALERVLLEDTDLVCLMLALASPPT